MHELQSSLFPEETLQTKLANPLPAIMLALVLDHRQWLRLLADDWWPLQNTNAHLHLGVGRPPETATHADRPSLIAWINPSHLPNIPVQAYRQSTWLEINLRELTAHDEQIIWPGPIPLFAIYEFCASNADHKAKLLALSKQFGNLAHPEQAIIVKTYASLPTPPLPPETTFHLSPPANWNFLRGAAAMAVWAVPGGKPWLDILCQSLALNADPIIANTFEVPWWNEPPWKKSAQQDQSPSLTLWRAMLHIFSETALQKGWQRTLILQRIFEYLEKTGAHMGQYTQLEAETQAILADKQKIDIERGKHDPVGLILQLLLLRPNAEEFITWKDDLPAMPPAVWWSGAMLSGYLTGYTNLQSHVSGTAISRQLIALRTWQLNADFPDWPNTPAPTPTWRFSGNAVQIIWNDEICAERKQSNRSKWYTADLQQEHIRKEAILLTRRLQPANLQNILRINNAALPYSGSGTIKLATQQLAIDGNIAIVLPENITIQSDLNDTKFRKWLLQGSISDQLTAPPPNHANFCAQTVATNSFTPEREPISTSKPSTPTAPRKGAILGLLIASDFISMEEEQALLHTIDQAPWLPDLKRRVQHYGWKYDYKKRKISRDAYLGPLPPWAKQIAERLFQQGLVNEMPDQAIINEYIANQGISKHIDCPSCFRGAIVTISLLESWEMVFRNEAANSKITQILERCSAVVMDGEVRTQWTHEIPKKKKEAWGMRGRRVSITFRKVDLNP